MAKFDHVDYTKFVADYSVKNGELGSEYVLNMSPQRLKKEVNNLFNTINIVNDNDLLPWSPVEDYLVGELVQNFTADNRFYRSRRNSRNKRPDLFPNEWEIAVNTDYTRIGDFNNFLAKDNITAYTPTDEFHPSTKGYVDYMDSLQLDIDGKAVDSALLNGEEVLDELGNSATAPISQNQVNILNNKTDTKLNASEFNSTTVMAMVQNVDGVGTGLDADYLDGQSSEFFMKVGETSNLDTMLIPGTYLIEVGSVGAPNIDNIFTVIVTGTGNLLSQIASSVSENKLFYRSYVGSWCAWKELVDVNGNVETSSRLENPVFIKLSGDVEGTVSFDGSNDVTIISTVLNDSHTHDNRYYTETEQDNRFLGINAKADDSDLLDGQSSEFFMKVGETSNLDTMLIPGTYSIEAGSVGAPNIDDTFTVIVTGTGNLLSQIATSVSENKLFYRSYIGSWGVWKGIADVNGNVKTASELENPVFIKLSGDVEGSVSFDGSNDVTIISTVLNDSHTHDDRYYTETEQDNRFLGINAKADDSDLLDGQSSEFFMKVGETSNLDTMLIPGTYSIEAGSVGAPNIDSTFTVIVTGTGNLLSQIATSVTENKLFYRSYIGSWGVWKEFADVNGNVGTASKLKNPVFIELSGDVEGSVSFDGSNDVTITSTVLNDSHTHDDRYYTETEQDNRFLGINAKADDSDLLDGHDSSVSALPNTVVVRDSDGNISGTSSSAVYADLAELYPSKSQYSVGTLVQISNHDDYDIEENVNNIFGVISNKPGFILDDNINGLPVAMVGKTIVRVIGKIKKGDKITQSGSVAIKAQNGDVKIGIALENKYTDEETLIKCFVQVQL